MLDIVQSFPLLSYCIVSPIYISPMCNVESDSLLCGNNKIRNSLFLSSQTVTNIICVGSFFRVPCSNGIKVILLFMFNF